MDLFKDIPAAQAMGIEVVSHENGRIELAAPLEPNLNDKGTGFAGSIASMLTLAGWALITLELRNAGIEADVMVVESNIHYSAPVLTELHAFAELSEKDIGTMLGHIQRKGRARVNIENRLEASGQTCATMTASFAVVEKREPVQPVLRIKT